MRRILQQQHFSHEVKVSGAEMWGATPGRSHGVFYVLNCLRMRVHIPRISPVYAHARSHLDQRL